MTTPDDPANAAIRADARTRAAPSAGSAGLRKFEALWKIAIFLIIAGLASEIRGKDYNWDLRNYHYYDPWALLNHRYDIDCLAAQVQTYLYPLIDLPFYFAVASGLPDDVIVFLLGAPTGLAAYVLWETFRTVASPDRRAPVGSTYPNQAAACFLATTGAAGFSELGTTTGEWTTTALVAAGGWALLSAWAGRLPVRLGWALAGAAFGAACALKLTSAPAVAAITVAAPWLLLSGQKGQAPAAVALYATTGVVTFIGIAGLWTWQLESRWGDPFFPNFNNIFHSPYADSNIDLNEYKSKNVASAIYYPIKAGFRKGLWHYGFDMRDPRLLIGFSISISWIFGFIANAARRTVIDRRIYLRMFLATAFVVTYSLWMGVFGAYRYAIVLELLACLMLFIEVDGLLARGAPRAAAAVSTVSYVSALLLTVSPDTIHIKITGGPYFSSGLPALPGGSTVINLTQREAVGYLVPQWPGHPPFLSPITNLSWPGYDEYFQARIAARVAAQRGPLYVLEDLNAPAPLAPLLLERYRLMVDLTSCAFIRDPMDSVTQAPGHLPPRLAVCRADRRA